MKWETFNNTMSRKLTESTHKERSDSSTAALNQIKDMNTPETIESEINSNEVSGRMQRLVSSDSENYPQEFRWNTEEHHNDNTETMDAFLDYMMPDNWTEMESQRDGTYAEAMVNGSELLLRLDASGDGDPYNHLVVASIIF